VPDARLGETVMAWVVLRPGSRLTEEGLQQFCRGRIAHYKVPARVAFVAEFPMTVTGKVQKFKLREMAQELRS
jgi:fatty-acyl-CoA synthase